MISQQAIKEFVNKKYENWDWIKELSKEDLWKYLYKLYPEYNYKTVEPKKHQIEMIILGILNPKFLFFAEMGLGKSYVLIELIKYYKSINKFKKALIISPNITSVINWGEEIDKHSDLSHTELTETIKERKEILLNSNVDIYNLNYKGLQLIFTFKKNNQLQKDNKILSEILKDFNFFVIDESHKCKNKDSLNYTICSNVSSYCDYIYGLTGTPMDKTPLDLWSQFNIVDKGETLGQNITLFRESFFNIKQNFFGGFEYKFKKELESNLNNRIKNKSITILENEVNDLPPKIIQNLKIILPKENQEYYNEVIQGYLKANGDINVIKNTFHKLRMICSGFIGFISDDNEKITMNLKQNPKLDELLEIISNLNKNKKIIVFSYYINSNNLICKGLEKNKIKYHQLYGKTKNKGDIINKFKTDDSKILSINIESGKEALNLQVASYVYYYDLPISFLDYAQSSKRTHRTGQDKAVFIYHAIIKNSIEEKILSYLKNGASLYSAILNKKDKII